METSEAGSERPFFGWRVVGAAFVAQLLGSAVTLSAFGNFVVPLSETFDVQRGRLNLGASLAIVAMGVLGPFVGRWLDRGLARPMMLIGTAVSGLGLMLLSRTTSLWQMALVFCVIVAGGTALFGHLPSMTVVANWFVRRRGLALGITVAGATVSSWVAPASAEALIAALGWRGAMLGFGLVTLVLGLPVFAYAAIGRPEAIGQTPDGDPPLRGVEGVSPEPPSIETAELIRDPRIWLVAIGFGLVFTSPIVMIVSLVPYGRDLGFSGQQASSFFLTMAPFSLIGKLVFGALADRIPPKPAIALVVIMNVLVWALLWMDPSYTTFLVIGALYGVGVGATTPLHGVVLGLCFGREGFGRASGIGGLASLPLIALSPMVAGLLYDSTGSYHATFVVQAGLLVVGGLLLSAVRIPRSAGATA